MSSRRSRLLAWGALSVGAVILLSSCSSGAVDSSTSTTASTTSAQPTTTSVDQEAARLAAQQSAAESSRLAEEEAARVAAEQENARLAAEEAARAEVERVAAEQAAAEQAAAEQAAAEQAERQAVEEQTQFDAAVEAGSCTEAPEDRVGECVVLVEERGAEAAAESGWYDPSGQWISPDTAKRALAAGIPPGGSVPGSLRCGSICGEWPTSGELQAWSQGLDPVPPGYEQWLDPNYNPYADSGR